MREGLSINNYLLPYLKPKTPAKMNGAESLVRTLIASGVEVCFTNPGTSEMHFVAALDRVPGMRCILGLFEGVVTGAADGYARMHGRPACTLLHLGPGFANGFANLHNARKARTPVVNIVGDHATRHLAYDAPLTADIKGVAGPVSHWLRSAINADHVAVDGAAAVAAACSHPGRIATLILPADTAWGDASAVAPPMAATPAEAVEAATIQAIAGVLRRRVPSAIYLGGKALSGRSLEVAGRIAQATGAQLLAPTANARHERGGGRVAVPRVPYLVDRAAALLRGLENLILVGVEAPVAFFSYPNKPSLLAPPGCAVHALATPLQDSQQALQALADELNANTAANGMVRATPTTDGLPTATAKLSIANVSRIIAEMIPEDSIVIDEAITVGRDLDRYTIGAKPHDWLQICGGAIGIGLPLAIGAAVACPQRKVIGLQADGSAMYTIQALWTQARENLNITTVVFANRKYEILLHELHNVGATSPGRRALDMLSLDRPYLDFCALAGGMGVESVRVSNCGSLMQALRHGIATNAPYLIEVMMEE